MKFHEELALQYCDSKAETEAGRKRSLKYFLCGEDPEKYLRSCREVASYLKELEDIEKMVWKPSYPAWVNYKIIENIYKRMYGHKPTREERLAVHTARELYFYGKDATRSYDYINSTWKKRDSGIEDRIHRVVSGYLADSYTRTSRSDISGIGMYYGRYPMAYYVCEVDTEGGRWFVDLPKPTIINCRRRKRLSGRIRKFQYDAKKDTVKYRTRFLDTDITCEDAVQPCIVFKARHAEKYINLYMNRHLWHFVDHVGRDRTGAYIQFKPFDKAYNGPKSELRYHPAISYKFTKAHDFNEDVLDAYRRRRAAYYRDKKSYAIKRLIEEKPQYIYVSYEDSREAGNCHPGTVEFFERHVAPILKVDNIEKVGAIRGDVLLETGQYPQNSLLRNAIITAVTKRYTDLLEV